MSEQGGGERPRVLVVEDDDGVASVVARTLSRFDVRTAASGEEALEQLNAAPFDLVLSDLNLPDMTGKHLEARCAQIENFPSSPRRFGFMTGGVFLPDLLAFLDERPWIEKPFTMAELRKFVDELIDEP